MKKLIVHMFADSLGYYPTKEKAAKAYNKAAKQYFGEFACLNKIL